MQGGITCQANLCTGSVKALDLEVPGVWIGVDERPLTRESVRADGRTRKNGADGIIGFACPAGIHSLRNGSFPGCLKARPPEAMPAGRRGAAPAPR